MEEKERIELGRYEYVLWYDRVSDCYWIVCHDLVRVSSWLRHGPFSLGDARTMMNDRIQRCLDLKRD